MIYENKETKPKISNMDYIIKDKLNIKARTIDRFKSRYHVFYSQRKIDIYDSYLEKYNKFLGTRFDIFTFDEENDVFYTIKKYGHKSKKSQCTIKCYSILTMMYLKEYIINPYFFKRYEYFTFMYMDKFGDNSLLLTFLYPEGDHLIFKFIVYDLITEKIKLLNFNENIFVDVNIAAVRKPYFKFKDNYFFEMSDINNNHYLYQYNNGHLEKYKQLEVTQNYFMYSKNGYFVHAKYIEKNSNYQINNYSMDNNKVIKKAEYCISTNLLDHYGYIEFFVYDKENISCLYIVCKKKYNEKIIVYNLTTNQVELELDFSNKVWYGKILGFNQIAFYNSCEDSPSNNYQIIELLKIQ